MGVLPERAWRRARRACGSSLPDHFTAPSERPWTSLSWAANPATSTGSETASGGRAHLGEEQPLAGHEAGEEHRGRLVTVRR